MSGRPDRIGRRFDYIRRLVGTGLSFTAFGVGALVLSVFVFPALHLVVADRARRVGVAQRIVHRAFRLFVLTMTLLGVMDVKVTGEAALQTDRGRLIVANHPSLIDVVLLVSLLRQTQCVVKHQNWRNPFMRGVLQATGYIRNDDDPEKLISACADALRAGHNLVIFPEGSRTVPGRPRLLQRGFANIALAAEASVRLVTIHCAPTTLTKGEKWYEIPPARAVFAVAVHELIDVRALVRDDPPSIAVRRLTRHVGQRFGEILGDVGA
jgi:1-acyl-sn-glycerol-3-phosphate acyltransferase